MRKNQISVSIIVPVYNVKQGDLQRCLSSIDRQVGDSCAEVILVFDGALPIGLLKVVNDSSYSFSLKTACIVHSGVSAARNTGMELATGEWVMFVDADDSLLNDSISILLKYGEKYSCDVVMGSHVSVMDTGREIHRYSNSDELFVGKECELFCESVLYPQRSAGLVWGKLFKRELLKRISAKFNINISVGEDSEFTFRVCAKSYRIGYVDSIVYQYYRNPKSIVRSFSNNYVEDIIDSLRTMRNTIQKSSSGKKYLKRWDNYVLYHLTIIMINYLFNPDAPWSAKERKLHYRQTLDIPDFSNALHRYKGTGFSPTRTIAIFSMKYKLYKLSSTISYIRQLQFRNNHNRQVFKFF